ncbi:MAG: LacI family transcriptional regulator, partial [Nitrospirae bacterium]
MSVTIEQLARLAGVSVSTVSKALNGYRDVSDETRERILAVAQETGYYPN